MHWTRSGDLIIMITLGGMQTLVGSIVGAFALLGLERHVSAVTVHWQIVVGLLLIGVSLFLQEGLVSFAHALAAAAYGRTREALWDTARNHGRIQYRKETSMSVATAQTPKYQGHPRLAGGRINPDSGLGLHQSGHIQARGRAHFSRQDLELRGARGRNSKSRRLQTKLCRPDIGVGHAMQGWLDRGCGESLRPSRRRILPRPSWQHAAPGLPLSSMDLRAERSLIGVPFRRGSDKQGGMPRPFAMRIMACEG